MYKLNSIEKAIFRVHGYNNNHFNLIEKVLGRQELSNEENTTLKNHTKLLKETELTNAIMEKLK